MLILPLLLQQFLGMPTGAVAGLAVVAFVPVYVGGPLWWVGGAQADSVAFASLADVARSGDYSDLTGVPSADPTTFAFKRQTGVFYAAGLQSGTSNVNHNMVAAGRLHMWPVYLFAGAIDRVSVWTTVAADWTFWARQAFWTVDEAVALSLGKNPTAGYGWFGDDEHAVGAGEGGNGRATRAGRAVHENGRAVLFLRQLAGLFANKGNQLA